MLLGTTNRAVTSGELGEYSQGLWPKWPLFPTDPGGDLPATITELTAGSTLICMTRRTPERMYEMTGMNPSVLLAHSLSVT